MEIMFHIFLFSSWIFLSISSRISFSNKGQRTVVCNQTERNRTCRGTTWCPSCVEMVWNDRTPYINIKEGADFLDGGIYPSECLTTHIYIYPNY